MTAFDPKAFEEGLIADMRANGGRATQGPPAGHPLLIMTGTGAKTGEPRRAILTFHRDGNDYVVAGTAAGSPTTPAYIHNLRAHPEVAIEVQNKVISATARVIAEGAERDELWQRHVDELPWFADHPKQSGGRVTPMVRLTPTRDRAHRSRHTENPAA